MKGRTPHDRSWLTFALAMITRCGTAPRVDRRRGPPDSDQITIGSIHPDQRPLAGVGAADGRRRQAGRRRTSTRTAASRPSTAPSSSSPRATAKGEAETGQSEAQRMIDEGAVALVGHLPERRHPERRLGRRAQPGAAGDRRRRRRPDPGAGLPVHLPHPAQRHRMGHVGADRLREIAEQGGEQIDSVAYIHEEGAFGDQRLRGVQGAGREPGHHRRQGGHLLADQLLRRHHPGARGCVAPNPTSSSAPATSPTSC